MTYITNNAKHLKNIQEFKSKTHLKTHKVDFGAMDDWNDANEKALKLEYEGSNFDSDFQKMENAKKDYYALESDLYGELEKTLKGIEGLDKVMYDAFTKIEDASESLGVDLATAEMYKRLVELEDFQIKCEEMHYKIEQANPDIS